jgi:hypothetical protein
MIRKRMSENQQIHIGHKFKFKLVMMGHVKHKVFVKVFFKNPNITDMRPITDKRNVDLF